MATERRRRQHGTGSVYQRADGRWVGSLEAGWTATGARRRITVTGKTQAEAKRRLTARQNQIAAEGMTTAASSRTTVKSWSEQGLEITRLTLRPRPWATDRSAVRQWIVPTIGHKRLDQLSPADVRAVAEAQRKAGRSSSTALRTHTTLTAMIRAAITEGHQVPRRVLDVKAPAKAVSDRTSMSIPEALAMLQVASFLPHGSRWAMAFLHGMRQGECLGLTWDCVDLDAGLVTVRWELQALPYVEPRNPASGFRIPEGLEVKHLVDGYHLLPPKTRAGFRMVPLVPAMREALADWREVAPANPWGLVWPTAEGRPANEKHDREEWHALQCTAEVGHPAGRWYHPHEARHTTATQLLEAGVDPHQITALMGHSSILTTRGYQHPGARPALAALEAVAGALELSPRA
jgi:integrase